MRKRVVAISLVLVGTIWLASSRAAREVIVLQPIRSFQVPGLEHSRLNDVAVYNGDFFLLLRDPSGSSEILRITGNGDILAKIPLPSIEGYPQLRISLSGTLAVSFQHFVDRQPMAKIFLYDIQGAFETSFDVPPFNEIAFIDDDLVGVGHSGVVRLTCGSQFMPNGGTLPIAVLDRGAQLITASLPQNKLAILEIISGRLQIAAMNAVLAGPMVLYAPEIQGVERPKIDNGWVAVVHTVASNPAGDLYLGITGGKRQQGAPVLQLDGAGTLRNRINCILPTFGRDPADFESYMMPTKLLATNDLLFWISMSEKKFVAYSVPSLH
jgi:hypothetical protein